MPGSEQPVSSASGAPHHFSGSQGIRHHLGGPLSAAGPGWDHAAAECIRTCGLCPPPPPHESMHHDAHNWAAEQPVTREGAWFDDSIHRISQQAHHAQEVLKWGQ